MGTLVFQATLGGAVNIIGPNIANTINFTLPSADGTSGQTWTTNGSGVLAFGTLGIAGGGTGQITATAAFNALAPSQSGQSGKYLTTDGTNTSWGTNPLGTVTSVAATVPSFLSIAGSPITTSGTLAFTLSGTALPTTSGGTGLTSFTSGGVVYASSTSALATGSALTFDGSALSVLTSNALPFQVSSSNASATLIQHTNSNASVDLFYRFRQNAGAGNWYDLTMEGSTNAFTIDYNDNERLRIDSSGNVSISSTTEASSTTTASLKTAGGLGVAKKAYFGDDIFIRDLGRYQNGYALTPTNTTRTYTFSSLVCEFIEITISQICSGGRGHSCAKWVVFGDFAGSSANNFTVQEIFRTNTADVTGSSTISAINKAVGSFSFTVQNSSSAVQAPVAYRIVISSDGYTGSPTATLTIT